MPNMVLAMDSMRLIPEKCLDPQLWHACAGSMVQIPPVNSKVFYFPQGHAEHAKGFVDFGKSQFPPFIPCSVTGIKYLADPDNDEIFAKITMVPLRGKECRFDDGDDGWSGNDGVENPEKAASFAKTLTQSDANNGGGFSVPRYCAETIFPRLDYSVEPPLQTIIAKDVHGQSWKFRHIYRGTPRRHLLTTGWSNFVNQKKLVAGDSVVFLRADNGDLCVGIRRAKRVIGPEFRYSAWNNHGNSVGEPWRKVTAESVMQAIALAIKGNPFDVIFYPRAGTPEFFVRASSVNAAMQIQWCPGMRFKMPFETEDASRISWFMGTISSVRVADSILWPSSPWRLLQVAWDEPDLLQNVKSISPWLVELVTSMPSVHLSPYSPPRKKLRMPPPNFALMDPSFTNDPLNPTSPSCHKPGKVPAGIQGARHSTRFGSFPPDIQYNPILSSPDPFVSRLLPKLSTDNIFNAREGNRNDNMSCWLTMGNSEPCSKKAPYIVLFGQMIPTDHQTSDSSSVDTMAKCLSNSSNSSEGSPDRMATGHCKVFDESYKVTRTLDLSALGSYEEL